MADYIVTKQRVVEIMTRIPAEIKLFKDVETGKIIGELIVDNTMFGDFNLESPDMACTPNDEGWKVFFTKQFDGFDMTNLIREK